MTRHSITLVATFALLLVCGCANQFLYYPEQRTYQTPDQKGLPFEEITFTSRDGTALTGWFVPAKGKPIGTVIHFHGNAQNMTAHFSFVDWLPGERFNVFTFDYRGYGRSAGKPHRSGVYSDCVAALDYVKQRPDIDQNSLCIFGQSLGGANAIAVLGEHRFEGVRAVAIDSSFYSYRSIARDKIGEIPILGLAKWPLSLLTVSNRHSPGPVVQNIAPTPLLLIHGTSDLVVPFRHARALLREARAPKDLWSVEGAGHTGALTTYPDIFRKRLVEFFTAVLDGA